MRIEKLDAGLFRNRNTYNDDKKSLIRGFRSYWSTRPLLNSHVSAIVCRIGLPCNENLSAFRETDPKEVHNDEKRRKKREEEGEGGGLGGGGERHYRTFCFNIGYKGD